MEEKKTQLGSSSSKIKKKKTRVIWRPVNLITAQFRFNLPPFGVRIPGDPFRDLEPRPPGSMMEAIHHAYLTSQHMTYLSREVKTKRRERKLKSGSSSDSCFEDLCHFISSLEAAPSILLQFVVDSVQSDKGSGCDPEGPSLLHPGTYLPQRAILCNQHKDPTQTIVLLGKKTALVREPGLYELYYRDSVFFVDPRLSGTSSFFPSSFSAVLIAMFTVNKRSQRAEIVPQTLTILLPTLTELTGIPPPPFTPLSFFSFASNLFQYPTATVRHRICECNTRVGIVTLALSNVSTLVAPPDLLPTFFDFDGVFSITRLHD